MAAARSIGEVKGGEEDAENGHARRQIEKAGENRQHAEERMRAQPPRQDRAAAGRRRIAGAIGAPDPRRGAAHGEARPQAHRGETRGDEDRQRRGGLDPPERVGARRGKMAAGGEGDDESADFEAEGGEREQPERRARR